MNDHSSKIGVKQGRAKCILEAADKDRLIDERIGEAYAGGATPRQG